MSVTLFNTGVEITDEMAARLATFCEAVALPLYMDKHDDTAPPGWPAPSARKLLAEWAIKHLAKDRVEKWEERQAHKGITIVPWTGGDVDPTP